MKKKIVLAYSGGLDTSVILHWLKQKYNADIIAYAADLGQKEELKGLDKKAKKTGAKKIIIKDLRNEFITDYLWPLLKSGAKYEGKNLLGTSIARPLIAKHQVEIAKKEKAYAVAHGATGKGNDQVRFELTFMALNPKLEIISPWKDPSFPIKSREDAVEYANTYNIPIEQTKKKIYSRDRNFWHISHEGAELENPANEPNNQVYTISQTVEKAPNKAEYITINFKKGLPVGINSKKAKPIQLLEKLNAIGGKHAIGQIDMIEDRLVGMKSRGVYETPGGTILYEAHDYLEKLVLSKRVIQAKEEIALKYGTLVYNGEWFTHIRRSYDAFINETQKYVTGDVRLKLFKGNIIHAGTKSKYSLHSEDLATFGEEEVYNQSDAIGFIKLYGLQMKAEGKRKKL
ncbi:argininosuccinate synthase [Candidatus Margulisiibacteriota bacterium]